MGITNIKRFLLTFSFSPRFESRQVVSETGKVQAAFTCEQLTRVYIINVNAQNAIFAILATAVSFHNEGSSNNQ